MSTILGVDLGEKRIGIALAEDGDLSARPLTTLRRHDVIEADLADLVTLIEQHGVDEVVVGLPYEAAGHEGRQAAVTRAWASAIGTALEAALGDDAPKITFRDERLSSHLAETRLGPMRRGRSGGPPTKTQRDAYRSRVDREAAAIILQDELDTRRDTRASTSPPATSMETPR